jgi:hypothetical protein
MPLRTAERVARPLGLARWDLIVLRSPATPAAGLVLLEGHRRTGDDRYLAAARRTGDLLARIQLAGGGWFSEMPVEDGRLSAWFPVVVWGVAVDDDVTPGAVRFLLALWGATGTPRYRNAARRGLALLVRAQLAGGAWPLVERRRWVRAFRTSYADRPSVNDGATPFAIATVARAAATLGRPRLLVAARRGADWLARVQSADGGWAQQYDESGRPAAGRRFEVPALSSWETRYAVDGLLAFVEATGEHRHCAAVGAAVDWLRRSALRPGCWARLYALGTGEPVYLATDGRRVEHVDAAYRHYGWAGDFGIPGLLARVDGLSAPVRVPGDPGTCPGEAPRGIDADDPDDPRAAIARAAIVLAASAPPAPSPCR